MLRVKDIRTVYDLKVTALQYSWVKPRMIPDITRALNLGVVLEQSDFTNRGYLRNTTEEALKALETVTVSTAPAAEQEAQVTEVPQTPKAPVKNSENRYLHIALVLDTSGSMKWAKASGISLLDRCIAAARNELQSLMDQVKAYEGKFTVNVTLVSFSNAITVHTLKTPLEKLYLPHIYSHITNGGTALNTAVVETLGRLKEDKTPGQKLLLVLTDGEENQSGTQYPITLVRKVISELPENILATIQGPATKEFQRWVSDAKFDPSNVMTLNYSDEVQVARALETRGQMSTKLVKEYAATGTVRKTGFYAK
jgi:Mg-chelatase subunit ChlD